jgi:lipopolysaccharide/colanic/teichoic acid biosynthesis glycosyltransferase
MYVNSDKDVNRKNTMEAFIKGEHVAESGSTKVVNKSSITPIGKFIRKYSLDELPQLFNVLIGDMSLVGPRPCVLSEWKIYEKWQKYRLDFVPGCTGVWQVCGRSEVNFEESVLMDIYYNQNHSLWFDFKIMLKTISVVFTGKGGA